MSDASDLIQRVLAALGPSQHQRLIRLHTPLGADVLLAERLVGAEAIGPTAPRSGVDDAGAAGFRFELQALSTNAHLTLKDLIGQPVRIDLLTQASSTRRRPFHGHVTAFALLGSNGGLARYRLVVEPWLAFLAHRQDAWVFQDQTVMGIVDEVFADHVGGGRLAPAWRWELADAAAYPQRSLCIQYHESDLAFVQRLLREEGLFCWFEHEADDNDAFGRHTLVIADHNGACRPNPQAVVRYTQTEAASFGEDGLRQFAERRAVASTALSLASWDHRTVVSIGSDAAIDERLRAESLELPLVDQPGAYAYEDASQANRLAQRHMEALQAPSHQYTGRGPWRQAACGTTFRLRDHGGIDPTAPWVVLSVRHQARNNLDAELATTLATWRKLGAQAIGWADASDTSSSDHGDRRPRNAGDEPLYESRLCVQDARVPVRPPTVLPAHGDLVFERPRVPGAQTAIVVGLGEPVHTDRDGRIKVQFHWQRGVQAAHRLDHPAGSNAPGDAGAGTWVRVAQAWAGANWGSHFVPRLGQEVLVAFIEGDIDRPVVIGSLYNGQGQTEAQGNQVAAGAATATGNAGAWFPGSRAAGAHEGHRHGAVLSGFKSQSLDSSASGHGGHNQLVFDDTPGQARVALGSTQAQTWLQIGHLLQQNDNERLAPRGHGLDLTTEGHGALRAGSGLHVTAYARSNGTEAGAQLAEAGDAMAQLQQAADLTTALANRAQQHHARFEGEPAVDKLPMSEQLQDSIDSLQGTDQVGASSEAQGGVGVAAQWTRPELVVSAPAGIAMATPGHHVVTAGRTVTLSARQDIDLAAQRHVSIVGARGVSLFTAGEAKAGKPITETGLQFHAASGSVSLQAAANVVSVAADRAIDVSSVTDAVTITSTKHVMLAAGGSGLRIEKGAITLTTPGQADFLAAMKELTDGEPASGSLKLPAPKPLQPCAQPVVTAAGNGDAFLVT